ncbi:PIN domain-containing protein [soil metagenome]
MTVVDSSAVIDLLLGGEVVAEVSALLAREDEISAPDLLVFEVLSALRRETFRGTVPEGRAATALEDLGDLRITLLPSLGLRHRAWELRANLTASDALFVALAEELGERLATKDRGLTTAARRHTGVEVLELGATS